MLALPIKNGPRGSIQKKQQIYKNWKKPDRNFGTTKRGWYKGSNPEYNTEKTLCNPEDDKNSTTISPRENTVIPPLGDS